MREFYGRILCAEVLAADWRLAAPPEMLKVTLTLS